MVKNFKQSIIAGLSALLLLASASCKTKDEAKLSEEVSLRNNQGGALVALTANEQAFWIKLTASSAWEVKAVDQDGTEVSWLRISPTSGGAVRDLGIAVTPEPNRGIQRTAFIVVSSLGKQDTLTITQQGQQPTPDPNQGGSNGGGSNNSGGTTPVIPAGEIIEGDVTLMEIPRLSGGNNLYFVTHRVGGEANYSLEYDVNKRHSTWVAFSFNDSNSQTGQRRTDAWGWDPIIPATYEVDNSWFRGYDRGHLVASSDRVYSREANIQTFYYTNMSPQISGFNQKYWNVLEQRVQAWGRSNSFRDVIYVVKGGTIREDQIKSTQKGIMPVPKYYFMALLCKKENTYHSIAFWLEHKVYNPQPALRTVAVSVDKLEELTGFDFFPNLPDDIEQVVEAEEPNPSYWLGI